MRSITDTQPETFYQPFNKLGGRKYVCLVWKCTTEKFPTQARKILSIKIRGSYQCISNKAKINNGLLKLKYKQLEDITEGKFYPTKTINR